MKTSAKKTGHTPGPWRAISLGWGMQILPPQDYRKISVIAAIGDDEKAGPHRTAEVKANALLMAAAPDLLAALRPFANLWRPAMADQPDEKPIYSLDDMVITVGDVRRARAALASVEGVVK